MQELARYQEGYASVVVSRDGDELVFWSDFDDAGADPNASTPSGHRPIEGAAQRLLPATVAALLDLGAAPAAALRSVLVWWAANVRWAMYRVREVVEVVEVLRAGGAEVGDRERELAAEAGVETVVAALDA